MQELVSVIVPVYNVERYLKKCIDSILVQTYRQLEILLIDDGSTDRSGQLCDELKNTDSRICVLHKENGGQAEARNLGIKHAKGDYIMFVDADDWIQENMIEILLNCVHSEKADMVCCGYRSIGEDGKVIEVPKQKEGFYDADSAVLILLKGEAIHNVVWGKLLKREMISRIPFPQGCIHEDDFVVFRWIYASQKIFLLNLPLYNYLKRPESTMTTAFNPRRLARIDAARLLYQETMRHSRSDVQHQAYINYIEALRSMYICSMKYLDAQQLQSLSAYKCEIYKECKRALAILNRKEIKKADIFLIVYFPLWFWIYRDLRRAVKKILAR